MAGAERVFRLLDTVPDWSDAADAQELPTLAGRVEFRDVSFSYTPGKPVLREISFVAEPGQTVALVGHTGSGKSSLVNLLARFYLPDSGELRFDGHETRGIVNASLHRQLGLVPQQNFLFTGTILDNIRFSRPEATEDDVWAALEQLDCRDLFAALPDGLRTEAGERGGQLSLGQRQLVCFARALLADPRILILDEATSAIDSLTELRIQRALERLVKGRTSFVVAHRLSTIRRADLVLVLDDGRIVERGDHESLLAEDGHYAALWRANELTGLGERAVSP
jgi:ATP-binding cassette subfamily B protein